MGWLCCDGLDEKMKFVQHIQRFAGLSISAAPPMRCTPKSYQGGFVQINVF